jgi:polyamine oxidase
VWSKPDGKPYIVELGANWIQGLQSPGGPASPIWSLSQEFNITNTYSNYSSILTYDQTGYVDYSALLDDYEDAYGEFEQDAGYILTENLLDINVEAGLALAGWTPGNDPHAEAVDWWEWYVCLNFITYKADLTYRDWEFGGPPQESSQLFGVVNYVGHKRHNNSLY